MKKEYQYIEKIRADVHNFANLPKELKSNKSFVLKAAEVLTRQHHAFLRYVDETLKDDKEVVLKVVSMVGDGLSNASMRLRNDKEVLLAAVKRDIYSLAFAEKELQDKLRGKTSDEIFQYLETAILEESLQLELPKKTNEKPKSKL